MGSFFLTRAIYRPRWRHESTHAKDKCTVEVEMKVLDFVCCVQPISGYCITRRGVCVLHPIAFSTCTVKQSYQCCVPTYFLYQKVRSKIGSAHSTNVRHVASRWKYNQVLRHQDDNSFTIKRVGKSNSIWIKVNFCNYQPDISPSKLCVRLKWCQRPSYCGINLENWIGSFTTVASKCNRSFKASFSDWSWEVAFNSRVIAGIPCSCAAFMGWDV